jgi:hypothetical protein
MTWLVSQLEPTLFWELRSNFRLYMHISATNAFVVVWSFQEFAISSESSESQCRIVIYL